MIKGSKHSKQTLAKMRLRKHSKESRQKMSEAKIGNVPWMKGKHHSEETKKKLRISSTGRPGFWRGKNIPQIFRQKMSDAKKGSKHFMFGKHHSEETRRKMSLAQSGDRANNWRGGLTPKNLLIRMSLDYRLWRSAVFLRDNYTCQLCGQVGGKLNADHIKKFADYPELRFIVNNGRTLCEGCHKKTKTFGNKGSKHLLRE